MLMLERRQNIVKALNEKSSLRVKELALMFSVTEETIRRDLETLQAQGRLLRSHGGALVSESAELHYTSRETLNLEKKQILARKALEFVQPGDTVFMDSSSTIWQLARLIVDLELTVITNSIKVALELAPKSNIKVIAVGGSLSKNSLSFVGPLAQENLKRYHAAKFFASCDGVDLKLGFSVSSELQAQIKRQMLLCAEQSFLLMDSSKLGKMSLSSWANFTEVNCLITDHQASENTLADFKNAGLNVVLAE
jgi:DeoR family transcriptional regulator, L-fucose operon activator